MSFDANTLRCFPDSRAAAVFVAQTVSESCREAVAQRGQFHWVLAGGSTPELCYRLLRDMDLPWDKVHCWFGDERALPAGHPERNETMARFALLDAIPIPQHHIHGIHFGATPAATEIAAQSYAEMIRTVARFDCVLLGMGEDGHTASLFPNNAALHSNALAVPVYASPKPPAERVSLSFKALNNHRQCLIMATGAGKSPALLRLRAGEDLPVAHIHHATWIVDAAAWSA